MHTEHRARGKLINEQIMFAQELIEKSKENVMNWITFSLTKREREKA
jgi:hypothetical protein